VPFIHRVSLAEKWRITAIETEVVVLCYYISYMVILYSAVHILATSMLIIAVFF